MEMERFNGKAKEDDQGALALVLDLAKESERIRLFVVWSWATHFSFPRKVLRVLCGRAANNHHGFPAEVEVELLALTDCVAACVMLGSKN